MTSRFRKVVAALVATMAVTGVAIGGIAQASGTSGHSAAVHHKKHHKKHHRNRIPQHNGGDHDADNNGGPSDGDGNI
jgi:Spy/CpxP family protein refolding chaperone